MVGREERHLLGGWLSPFCRMLCACWSLLAEQPRGNGNPQSISKPVFAHQRQWLLRRGRLVAFARSVAIRPLVPAVGHLQLHFHPQAECPAWQSASCLVLLVGALRATTAVRRCSLSTTTCFPPRHSHLGGLPHAQRSAHEGPQNMHLDHFCAPPAPHSEPSLASLQSYPPPWVAVADAVLCMVSASQLHSMPRLY